MITIPREKLRNYWWEHIWRICDPRSQRIIKKLNEELGGVIESIRVNKKELVGMIERLFDDSWIKENHPWWEGIRIVRKKKGIRKDEFILSVKEDIEVIRNADPYLGAMIAGQMAERVSIEESQAVKELMMAVENKPMEAGTYISNNSRRLMQGMADVGDKRYSLEINRVISELKKEYDSMIRVRNYLTGWLGEIRKNKGSLMYCSERINEFILGLRKSRMEKLAEEIMKAAPVKNLLNLPEEIKYLGDSVYQTKDNKRRMGLLMKIELGEREANWQHFNEFYDNLESEEHDIVALYGDSAVKKEMVEFKKERHMWLEGWKSKVMEIERRISSPRHEMFVIEKGIEMIRQILGGYIRDENLTGDRLKPRIHTLAVLLKKEKKLFTKKRVLALCRVREKNLMKSISEARNRYKTEENILFMREKKLRKDEERLHYNGIYDGHIQGIEDSMESIRKVIRYMEENLKRLNRKPRINIRMITNAMAALGMMENKEEERRLHEIRFIRGILTYFNENNIYGVINNFKAYDEGLSKLNAMLRKVIGVQMTGNKKPREVAVNG
ncbi:hypothetical protein KY366_04775 [Candidatus Woesearchaeota archaeon]|nr:hypothetical protein [Candidatus Woesearchaeota archaeon]